MRIHTLIGSTLLATALVLTGCDDTANQQESSSMDNLKKEAGETITAAGEVYKDAKDKAQVTADDISRKAVETTDQIRESTGELYDQAKEGAIELGEDAAKTAEDLTEEASARLEEMKSSDS